MHLVNKFIGFVGFPGWAFSALTTACCLSPRSVAKKREAGKFQLVFTFIFIFMGDRSTIICLLAVFISPFYVIN